MHLAAVTTHYPQRSHLGNGQPIQWRVNALARLTTLKVLHVTYWFPWLHPLEQEDELIQVGKYPPVIRIPLLQRPRFFRAREGERLKKAILPALYILEEQRRLDVIDAHFGYPEGVGCVLAAKALNKPVFLTLHGPEAAILKDRSCGPQLIEALQQSAGVICAAPHLRELVLEHGVSSDKVEVIANGVNPSLDHQGARAEIAKSGLEMSWEQVARQTVDFFQKQMNALRASRPPVDRFV